MTVDPIDYRVILASKSPRRQELLKGLGFPFEVKTKNVEEIYPQGLKKEQVALYLSDLKAQAFKEEVEEKDLVITSDTIVHLDGEIMGKPNGRDEAFTMLKKLSGKKHEVITAVTLLSAQKRKSFFDITEVYFNELTDKEIYYYIDHYEPYDKAGSYGIQEWIGFIGIEKIVGSYFNVMGLPVKKVYDEILSF